MQPSHDTKPGIIAIEDTVERGTRFLRPSTSDMEGLRCNLATKFAAEAAADTRDKLTAVARPLAGTRASNPGSIPEPHGSSVEPFVGSQQDATLEPREKDPAPDLCLPSKETSAPDRCVASEKTSTPDSCVASQKKSKKPRRDSQQDSGPSKIPKTAMDEATSTPEPVEVSQKDPLPELSDGDAAGSAADIPDVPDSFTRAQQRKLRKDKVAAQRKRKHGEDEPEEAAGEWDEEEPEPCGRGRARGRGRGRGRGRSRGRGGVVEDDGDKPLRSLSRSRSPVVMKRPAAKGQVSTAVSKKVAEPGNKAKAASEVPKKAAGPKTKPRASSEVPKRAARPKTKPRAASEAASRENGASVNDRLKLVLQGLPLLKAETADMVKKRADYNSRDVLPIPMERRGPLKQIAGCTQLSHV